MNMDGKLVLTINTLDESVDTKAFPDSDDAIFENQIDRIDYFIYANGNEAAPALAGHLDTDAWHEKTFIVDLAGTEFDALFVTGNPMIYAVVNLPVNVSIPATVSLEALKNTVVAADFVSAASQKTLVMSGEKEIVSSGTGATCNIEVKRVAAKVTFDIEADAWCYEDPEDATSDKWYSHPEAMIVNFHNLASKAYVDGEIGSIPGSSFSYDENHPNRPFYYTYPREWEYGSTDEPYLFITMPVTRGSFDSSERREAYYKIIFANTSFESNCWYKYGIRLKMVGSFEREVPVVPTPEDAVFFVYKWGGVHGYNGSATEGQITGFRYLEVEDNSPTKVYYMYNQNVLDIPFKSSDVCRIHSMTATSPIFTGVDDATKNRAADVSVSIVDDRIVVRHNLDNNLNSSKYDYSPIDISFVIQHNTGDAQDANYLETIRIKQYPAMYIEGDKNTGGNIVSDSGTTKSDDKGYVFVYNNQLSTSSTSNWCRVRSCLDGGNNNPYMYVINTSTMDASLGLVLADPRERKWTASSLSLPNSDYYGNKLVNYQSTIEDSTSQDLVSPSFRMASSYGKCSNNMTKVDARRRCAAYQEQGRPAGRWRLPTYGELKYVQVLSSKGVIPQLYSTDNYYWTANGAVKYTSNPVISSNSEAVVRCVYDEWYWNNTSTPTVDKTHFTWSQE